MSDYREDDYLPLSGIQHFAYCRRQWALIHIEQQWAENVRTTEGNLIHARAHDEHAGEKRGNMLILRGLRIASPSLGLSGQCDVVEFHQSAEGVSLPGEKGLWKPFPVEYKRGEPKYDNFDRLQLCAQAMCLEDMLCCEIDCGALFYGQIKRRENVEFTAELREKVGACAAEMHQLYARGYTPKAKPGKGCNACSLKELCLPGLQRRGSAFAYLKRTWEELL